MLSSTLLSVAIISIVLPLWILVIARAGVSYARQVARAEIEERAATVRDLANSDLLGVLLGRVTAQLAPFLAAGRSAIQSCSPIPPGWGVVCPDCAPMPAPAPAPVGA